MAGLEFPTPESLFTLDDPISKRSMRGRFEDRKSSEISTGEYQPSAPIRVTWSMGGAEPTDFIWTTSAIPLIMHERILDIFRGNQFTGWQSFDVEVHDKLGNPVKGYHGLTVTGRCGPQDYGASRIVLKEYPGGWCPLFAGSYYSRGPWNGEAIFMPGTAEGGRSVSAFNRIITEPLAKALLKAKAKNIRIAPICDETIDVSTIENVKPDALPTDYWRRVEDAYLDADKPMPKFVEERGEVAKARIEALRGKA